MELCAVEGGEHAAIFTQRDARLTTVVFGASIAETAARGKARILVPATEINARGPTLIDVVPGVRALECLAISE